MKLDDLFRSAQYKFSVTGIAYGTRKGPKFAIGRRSKVDKRPPPQQKDNIKNTEKPHTV